MATQETKDGLGYIIQAINNIIEPKVSNLNYDKTYRAKVSKIIDTGIYKVQIKGAEYELSYNGTLNVGDIVKVKAPLNNFSDIYIETVPSTGGSGGTTDYDELLNKPIVNTNNNVSQTPEAKEILRGTLNLHKISKTGNYEDLVNKPALDFISTADKGVAGGVAPLDDNVLVPVSNLPIASKTGLGVIKVGNNLTVSPDGTLNAVTGGRRNCIRHFTDWFYSRVGK